MSIYLYPEPIETLILRLNILRECTSYLIKTTQILLNQIPPLEYIKMLKELFLYDPKFSR